jgi:hypothetical protein
MGFPSFSVTKVISVFRKLIDLIHRGGAFAVASHTELKEKFEMLNLPENFLPACEVTRAYVIENLEPQKRLWSIAVNFNVMQGIVTRSTGSFMTSWVRMV